MTVGQHKVLRSGLGLQADGDVADAVVVAGEAAQEVDAEGSGGPLHVHREAVGTGGALTADVLDLLQQVLHRQDLVLVAADGARPHAGDPLQMPPGKWAWREGGVIERVCERNGDEGSEGNRREGEKGERERRERKEREGEKRKTEDA